MKKQIKKSWTDWTAKVFMAMILCLAPLLPLGASSGYAASDPPVAESTPMTESDSEIVFDNEGTLDAVNPPMPSSDGEEQDQETFQSVIIDGNQYELSKELIVHHYLLETATVNDLKPEDYVGFKKDPADNIGELWILESDQNKTVEKVQEVPNPQPDAPSGSIQIRNEDGVWKN